MEVDRESELIPQGKKLRPRINKAILRGRFPPARAGRLHPCQGPITRLESRYHRARLRCKNTAKRQTAIRTGLTPGKQGKMVMRLLKKAHGSLHKGSATVIPDSCTRVVTSW